MCVGEQGQVVVFLNYVRPSFNPVPFYWFSSHSIPRNVANGPGGSFTTNTQGIGSERPS